MFFRPFQKRSVWILGLVVGLFGSCTTEQQFPSIGNSFSGPIDVVSHNNLLYVLNSDFDRRYNQGSILVVNPATEEKVAAHEVPRLGRSMHVVDDYMLVTYDPVDVDSAGSLAIYQLDGAGGIYANNPTAGVPVYSFAFDVDVNCSPINGKLSPSRTYAVISCLDGDLFVARLGTDPSNTDQYMKPLSGVFKLVREYQYARRALHIHEEFTKVGEQPVVTKSILLAFPTDMGEQSSSDFIAPDVISQVITVKASDNTGGTTIEPEFDYSVTAKTNEVPDGFETAEDQDRLRQLRQRFPFQYVIYDLFAEEALDFPQKAVGTLGNGDVTREVNGTTIFANANNELKFMYYRLPNPLSDPVAPDVTGDDEEDSADGEDPGEGDNSDEESPKVDTLNVYRTNFWSTQVPSSAGSNQFYLSQRGLGGSGDSNNVLKVTINTAALEQFSQWYASAQPIADPETAVDWRTDRIFSFERVSGFTSFEQQGYPGDFEIVDSGTREFLFVNQFRDEAYWDTSQTLYAVDAKWLGDDAEIITTPYRWRSPNFTLSAYQLASTQSGFLGACSFYGDALIVFPIDSLTGIDPDAEPAIIN
ncbi:MAG: hypothetical protein HRU19_11985 [Pseudobacteriovorax sp.]|nr:hypothetical protein [Pseudobacteriovorax sp.]